VTDLDREARHILELARRARTPTADDKARLERRLAGALLFGATSAHAGNAATSKVVAGAFSAKWGAIALLAVAGGAAYAGIRAVHAGAASAASATHLAAPTAPTSAVVSAAMDAPSPSENAAAETSNAAAAPTSMVAFAEPGAPRGPGDDSARDVPRAAPKHTTRGTLPEELDLLHDAQAKWRAGNASAALSLLAEHRSRFPHSELGPERDALTILSLCATNRTAEAKSLAQRFLKHARNSPLRSAVEESCGGK
jgi:hypothetical protein